MIDWVLGETVGDCPTPQAVGAPEDSRSSFLVMIVHSETPNLVDVLTAYGVEHNRDVPFFAFGSGAEVAIGAMAAGASAQQAIEIAAQYTSSAALPVQFVTHAQE